MTQPKTTENRESSYRMRVSQAVGLIVEPLTEQRGSEEIPNWFNPRISVYEDSRPGINIIGFANPPVENPNAEHLYLTGSLTREPEYMVVERPKPFQGQAGSIYPVHLGEGEFRGYLRPRLVPPPISHPNLNLPLEIRLFDATAGSAPGVAIAASHVAQEQSVESHVADGQGDIKEDYLKHLRRTHRIATIVFMVASVLLYLAALDLVIFVKDGNSLLHPVLSILLCLASGGLALTAAVSQQITMRYFLKTVKGT